MIMVSNEPEEFRILMCQSANWNRPHDKKERSSSGLAESGGIHGPTGLSLSLRHDKPNPCFSRNNNIKNGGNAWS
jgi:hypothetical protein